MMSQEKPTSLPQDKITPYQTTISDHRYVFGRKPYQRLTMITSVKSQTLKHALDALTFKFHAVLRHPAGPEVSDLAREVLGIQTASCTHHEMVWAYLAN